MPVVNPLVRELVFKVVYYGPGLGGKTTSLQHVYGSTKPEHRGKMVSLATPVDRTLYFDFLPIRIPHVRGMGVRLQLFTVPGQVYYNATRKLVLTGADGIVIVFDSQRERLDANLETLENLHENLRAHGKTLEEIPHVIQYNKRDIVDAVPFDELQGILNRYDAPAFETTAPSGQGIYEALEAIVRGVLLAFERRVPESRGTEGVATLELPEGGLVEALRRADRGSAAPASARPGGELDGVLLSQLPDSPSGEGAARSLSIDALNGSEVPATSPSSRVQLEATVDSVLAPARTATSRPSPASPVPGVSFETLWPAAERATVQELERALAIGDTSHAVGCADRLVARTLASAGVLLGGRADAPRDPATVALLLGLSGARYIELRALVRGARSGRGVALAEALSAYATALEVRLLRSRIGG